MTAERGPEPSVAEGDRPVVAGRPRRTVSVTPKRAVTQAQQPLQGELAERVATQTPDRCMQLHNVPRQALREDVMAFFSGVPLRPEDVQACPSASPPRGRAWHQ